MKKLFLSLAAIAAVMFSSCSSQDEPMQNVATDGMVSFAVQLPTEVGSRAISDGLSARDLTYAVFEEDGTFLFQDEKTAIFNNRIANVQIALATGKNYKVAFFAKNAAAPYTITDGVLSIDYTATSAANDDNYDAFYNVAEVSVTNGLGQQTVHLYRPFAQVNVGASDWAEAKRAGRLIDQTALNFTAEVYTTLNLFDGTVDDAEVVEFAMNTLPASTTGASGLQAGTLTVAGNDYAWMTMAYVLVPTAQQTVTTVDFVYNGLNGAPAEKFAVNSVPVQRNYRTNIVGRFFTADVEFNIIIEQEFEQPDYEIVLWDGTVTIPTPAPNGDYSIADPSELAGLAEIVASGDNLQGKTITLENDMDLGGLDWQPIGDGSHPFLGTFDGGGKTIKNVKAGSSVSNNVGLFGRTSTAEKKATITNLVIDGCELTGYLYVGAIAGTPYTSNVSNITLKGLVKIEGGAYVGGVLGYNVYGNVSNITVDVEPGSYVKSNLLGYRNYVGGVFGFIGEGPKTIENVTCNIDVYGTTCDVGGITGIAHYGNTFTNCSYSGNIYVTDGDITNGLPDGITEVGGIAGTWMNSASGDVNFNNCTFTGAIKSVIGTDGLDYTDLVKNNTIVGTKYYHSSSAGNLYIDGVRQDL